MKTIGKILILLAASILQLHSMVSHQHHDELSQADLVSQHESAAGFLDFVGIIFHVDLGEDHLEHYQTADANSVILFPLPVVSHFLQTPSLTDEEQQGLCFPLIQPDDRPPSLLRAARLHWRGPPRLS